MSKCIFNHVLIGPWGVDNVFRFVFFFLFFSFCFVVGGPGGGFGVVGGSL